MPQRDSFDIVSYNCKLQFVTAVDEGDLYRWVNGTFQKVFFKFKSISVFPKRHSPLHRLPE